MSAYLAALDDFSAGVRASVPNSPKIPYLPTLVGHRCASV
jgi:hypothetical protein